jgi:hypothetical protein
VRRARSIDRAGAQQHVVEDDRKAGLVHLHTLPIGPAVEPGVLQPMPVGLLHGDQIIQDRLGMGAASRGEEPAGDLHEVARPHQMIAAQIVVALRRTPGDGKASDDRSRGGVAMGGQYGRANAIVIELHRIRRRVERQQALLPLAPAAIKTVPDRLYALLDADERAERRLFRLSAETDRKQRAAVAFTQIERAGKRDVSVDRTHVLGFHAFTARQRLPAI